MKNIIIIVSIFFTLNTIAQTNQVEVIAKGNCSYLTDNIYTIDIFIKSLNANETVTVKEQNYRFSYNTAAINNPIIITTTNGLGFNNPVLSENGNISFFEKPTLTGSLGNLICFNIEMSGGDGLPLTSANETYIGSIAFEVINSNLPYNFRWHHFVGSEENWPPTYIGIQNSTEKATGIFANHINELSITAVDFTRTSTHVCTIKDGGLAITYPNKPAFEDLFMSIDGGLTYASAGSNNPFIATGLATGDYDIKIKQRETGCPITLDDVNIIDLSHNVIRTWGHPACGTSDGWIELTWVEKALPKIDISIDGGQTYVSVSAADELYRIENLSHGDYDIRVKWSYAPYACPTILDDVNLRDKCKRSKVLSKQIHLYPNPAKQQITVNLNGQDFATGILSIYNLMGKQVQSNALSANKSNVNLQVGTLSNGIYLVKINLDSKEIYTQKLTIAH